MKNRLLTAFFAAIALIAVAFSFAACNDVESFTVTFDTDGGSAVSSQTVKDGEKAVEPTAPTKSNCNFDGWYLGETEYDFQTPVTANLTLTAHWTAESSAITHTVTFNSDGGSRVASQIVEHGKPAVRPADPVKYGYSFFNWSDSSYKLYDFSAPVTSDITLYAEWDPKQFGVTFDTDGGSAVQGAQVFYGESAEMPDNPTKVGFFFNGWYVGETKYDFSAPVEKDLTIKAHWISTAEFTSALAADYSNFTSYSKVTEDDLSLTDVFKQTENRAYWIPESELYDEHLLLFGDAGNLLANYYLSNGEWKRSNLSGYAEFVVALYLDEISVDDVEYDNGVYRVLPESVASVIYALFRSNESYENVTIQIADGRIVKVTGDLDGMVHEQTFTDFGTTVIDLPDNLPAVAVEITARNKQTEQGTSLNADELIKLMFSVKVEGKDYEVTSEMVDFGNLNFANPAAGEYTVTLSFKTWDDVTHTETAKVIVQEYQGGETFAEIFAKDYNNVTILQTGKTPIKFSDGVYCTGETNNLMFFYVEDNKSLTKYQIISGVYKEYLDNWYVLPRLDFLFDLSAEIFEQVGETDSYIAKNNDGILDILVRTTLTKSYRVNNQRDYSIALTVELGRVTKISLSYYCVTKASDPLNENTGTLRTLEYSLYDFGTTVIDVPDEILAMRNPSTAGQTALIQDKRYTI